MTLTIEVSEEQAAVLKGTGCGSGADGRRLAGASRGAVRSLNFLCPPPGNRSGRMGAPISRVGRESRPHNTAPNRPSHQPREHLSGPCLAYACRHERSGPYPPAPPSALCSRRPCDPAFAPAGQEVAHRRPKFELCVVATRPAGENGLGMKPAAAAEELVRIKGMFLFLPETPAIHFSRCAPGCCECRCTVLRPF
jgi:hypothetical protein